MWHERLTGTERLTAVARLGADPRAAIVGVVSWGATSARDAPPLELKTLYVDAAHHGSGLASALLNTAINTGPAHLWLFDGNARAEAFYRKHGFALDGAREPDEAGVDVVRTVRHAPRE